MRPSQESNRCVARNTPQGDQDAGQSFGGFAVAFGDPVAQVQAELGGGEGLDTDGEGDRDQRQVGETEAEADGEFVQADADCPSPAGRHREH